MNTVTQVFAGLLIVGGLLLVGFSTGAFDQVDADRGVSVDVADQGNAYLAIEDVYGGNTVRSHACIIICVPDDQPRTVVELENRFLEEYSTVEAEVVEIENRPNDVLEVQSVPSELLEGETDTLSLGCAGYTSLLQRTENITIDLTVTGDSIAIDTQVTIEDVEYRCYS